MFDDRLVTVLRMRAGSEAALRTQFRQLLDLLGTRSTRISGQALARLARTAQSLPPFEVNRIVMRPAMRGADPRLSTIAGFVRLRDLQRAIPQELQSAILREPGQRLRNPEFVAFLAEGEPKPAAAAVATARLTEEQWLDLIPRLPVTARGFLRHRRDLPGSVQRLLQHHGVGDLVLPMSRLAESAAEAAQTETPAPQLVAAQRAASPASSNEEGIAGLRRRIEAFREGRQQGRTAQRPAPKNRSAPGEVPEQAYHDVVTDAGGSVIRADGLAAPMLAGLSLTSPTPGALVKIADDVSLCLQRRLPVRGVSITIDAAPEISGEWRMDATPLFAQATGMFTGYAARLQRPVKARQSPQEEAQGDAMRQVLHELRTPVNAIQGFAEIIQQQIFGNVPHEYRAHAASIAVDAAKLLAGFEEVDRLVKLEAAAMQLEDGSSDFRKALVDTVQRLEGVLRGRNAGFRLNVEGSVFTVALDRSEALAMCWRLLATTASALAPGENAQLDLAGDGTTITLVFEIPESLRNAPADAPRDGQRRRAISAGMFGPRFSFRLAEAEASAAGGSLVCTGDTATLTLPALTLQPAGNSSAEGNAGA